MGTRGAAGPGNTQIDAQNDLVQRGYWLDMNDRHIVIVMRNGIEARI
jgi:hypothetical protein